MINKALEPSSAKPKGSFSHSWLNAAKPQVVALIVIALLALIIGAWFILRDKESNGVVNSTHTNGGQPQNSNRIEKETQLRLAAGATDYAFGNEVKITIDAIEFDKASSKYKVSATIIFPGEELVRFMSAEVNSKLSYPKPASFELEILDIQDSSVLFLVRKLKKPDNQP